MDDLLDISVIIPAYNEEACIEGTVMETTRVLQSMGKMSELIVVDDGSTDRTPVILQGLRNKVSGLRILRVTPRSGQSAAFGVGFRAARGRVTILMDADGQNDPADFPRLLEELKTCDVCCGWRKDRKDDAIRTIGSKMANAIRRVFLDDGILDTGCSLKAFKTEFVRDLPMSLRGMHRFLPALILMRGATMKQIAVNHRPRAGGKSKYTNVGRLRVTVADLWAVRWMKSRYCRCTVQEGGSDAMGAGT